MQCVIPPIVAELLCCATDAELGDLVAFLRTLRDDRLRAVDSVLARSRKRRDGNRSRTRVSKRPGRRGG